MDAHFTIDLDPARRLLNVVMGGFYTPDDVQRYHAAVHAATAKLGSLPSMQRMICDISAMRIQSQETVAAFSQVMADPKYRHRRIAFVVAGSLARMQAQRVLGDRQARLFSTYTEAEAWLFGDAEAFTARVA